MLVIHLRTLSEVSWCLSRYCASDVGELHFRTFNGQYAAADRTIAMRGGWRCQRGVTLPMLTMWTW